MTHLSRLKPRHLIPLSAVGGLAVVTLSFGGTPLLDTTEDFILFAQSEVKLEQGVQVSSGNIGSNNKLTINKESLITGDLFADSITLDKDTTVNGNAVFNTIQTHKDAQILGEQTDFVSPPIANLPTIPSFTIGTEDITFSGEGNSNTLPQGSYRNITLNKNSTLTLKGGVYNLAELDLREGSILLYATATTINIEKELKGQQNVSILNTASTTPNDLTIHYVGRPNKASPLPAAAIQANENANKEKTKGKSDEVKGKKDENGDIPVIDTENDNPTTSAEADVRASAPIHFGNNSFLNFILIAPNITVNIGERSTIRGQILADRIMVGKDSVLSRETAFVKESNPDMVVTDTDGSVFLVNEIMVNFVDSATFSDAQAVADLVEGQVVGFVQSANAYQIEVLTGTTQELSDKIETIRQSSSPLVEGVFRSYILDII